MRHHRPFLALWVLAVNAGVAAFLLHLAMRGRIMHLGYELGKARAEQAHLREVRRVLELEVSSYQTPQRVEVVARTLLGMEPPTSDRIFGVPAIAPPTAPVPSAAVINEGGGAVSPGVASASAFSAVPAASLSAPLLPSITPPKTAALFGNSGIQLEP